MPAPRRVRPAVPMTTADRPRGPRETIEGRIEHARGRLAAGFSRGELARELADEWGVARRTVRRYLDRAAGGTGNWSPRPRRTPSPILSRSGGGCCWTRWPTATPRGPACRRRPAGRRSGWRSGPRTPNGGRRAATYRDRLDRLLGLLSPAAAADRLTVAGGEPATTRAPEPADPDRAVRDLLNAAGVVAEFVPPAASR